MTPVEAQAPVSALKSRRPVDFFSAFNQFRQERNQLTAKLVDHLPRIRSVRSKFRYNIMQMGLAAQLAGHVVVHADRAATWFVDGLHDLRF